MIKSFVDDDDDDVDDVDDDNHYDHDDECVWKVPTGAVRFYKILDDSRQFLMGSLW